MSGANAISGVTILGAIVGLGVMTEDWWFAKFLAFLALVTAVVFAMINVVGGFMVTDRMLKMFAKKK